MAFAAILLALGAWGGYVGWKSGRNTVTKSTPVPEPPASQGAIAAIWEWRSPTAALLEPPDSALAAGPELDWRSIIQDHRSNN
jgi:hypothetical protein